MEEARHFGAVSGAGSENPSMIVTCPQLDLEQIDLSGQCFRWQREADGSYRIPAFGRVLRARQLACDQVELDCTEADWQAVWADYFDMQTDYAAIMAQIDAQDAYLRAAAACGAGIRILRQPLWEVIAAFIISQNNNIPRIRGSMARLCAGAADFPDPQAVARMDEQILRAAGLGYRADYLLRAAQTFSEPQALQSLAQMPYAQARETLMACRGIGPKVADCICLFGLGHREAFPVDTWVRRIVERHYGGRFPCERYPAVQGIMQQWMFAYERREAGRAGGLQHEE